MTAEGPRVSGDLLRLIIRYGSAAKLLREHAPDGKGRCSACRSIGCTLYTAALEAQKLGGSRSDR
jgi:hypothetical protein